MLPRPAVVTQVRFVKCIWIIQVTIGASSCHLFYPQTSCLVKIHKHSLCKMNRQYLPLPSDNPCCPFVTCIFHVTIDVCCSFVRSIRKDAAWKPSLPKYFEHESCRLGLIFTWQSERKFRWIRYEKTRKIDKLRLSNFPFDSDLPCFPQGVRLRKY